MRVLLAGAAAIALAASGAVAQGNGKGNGPDKDKSPVAAQSEGKGKPKGRDERRGKPSEKADSGARQAGKDRGDDRADRVRREDRSNDMRRVDRGDRRDDNRGSPANAGKRDAYRVTASDRDLRWLAQDRSRGLIDGCPPGLAKKRNGCNPPGQVKDRYERNLFGYAYRPRLFGLSNYRSGDYYYNDGYLVRYGNSGVAGWIPLLAGALGVGNVWPSGYQSYELPEYLVDYYDLGGPNRYRYADNVIYRVDPEDAAITSIAALITGDDFVVGQPVPSGYDVYNVPYGYRDRYYDTPEYMYRYSDGYVYRIDPETRLVAAAIDLLI